MITLLNDSRKHEKMNFEGEYMKAPTFEFTMVPSWNSTVNYNEELMDDTVADSFAILVIISFFLQLFHCIVKLSDHEGDEEKGKDGKEKELQLFVNLDTS